MAKDVEMHDASDAAPARARSVQSDAPTESGGEGRTRTGRRFSHRRKGVFDAVGGRTRVRESRPKWPGQPVKSRNTRLAPEEALFRSAGAPPRYEETDTYFAHADLPKDTLPSSELVKAVHHYASRYYEALPERVERQRRQEPKGRRETRGRQRGQQIQQPEKEYKPNRRLIDERSMDETALLAFGILLEEAGRAVLGRNGALVLTEAAGEDEADADDEAVAEELEGEQEAKKRKKKKKKSKKRKRNDDDD